MSFKQAGKVWGLKLKPVELLVLLNLADHAWEDGSHAYPGVCTIARQVNASRRTVQRVLRKLEKIGALEKIADGGGRKSTMYQLHLDSIENKTSPARGVKLSPVTQLCHPSRVIAVSPQPRHSCDALTVLEPPLNPQSVVRGVDEGGDSPGVKGGEDLRLLVDGLKKQAAVQ